MPNRVEGDLIPRNMHSSVGDALDEYYNSITIVNSYSLNSLNSIHCKRGVQRSILFECVLQAVTSWQSNPEKPTGQSYSERLERSRAILFGRL